MKWDVNENQILLNFLIDKSKNAVKPPNIKELSREFKASHETNRTEISIMNRMFKFRNEIHELKDIDEEVKEQLTRALGKENPEKVPKVPWSQEEDNDLVQFFAEESENSIKLNLTKVCKEYIESRTSKRTVTSVILRIQSIRNKIHEMDNIDEETRQRLIVALRGTDESGVKRPLNARWTQEEDNELLEILKRKSKENKPLKVTRFADEYKRANRTAYAVRARIVKLLDDNPQLTFPVIPKRPEVPEAVKLNRKPWSEDEERDLAMFLAEKTINAVSPIDIDQLPIDFQKENESFRTVESIRSKFEEIRKNIDFLKGIDDYTKEKMIFALNPPPVTSLLLPNNAGQYDAMLDFLAAISVDQKTPIDDLVFLDAYIEYTSNNASFKFSLNIQYQTAKKRIAASKKFDWQTKIQMMFVSSAPVSRFVLEKLREEATVVLDHQKFISLYKSFDGSLVLMRSPFHAEENSEPPLKAPKIEDDVSVQSTSSEAPPLKIPTVEEEEGKDEEEETKTELLEVKLEEPDF